MARGPSDRPPPALRARAAAPLIGRDGDRAALLAALSDGARLVTLTGPAGVGKTRLSDEVADEAAAALGGRALRVRLEHAETAAALADAVTAAAAKLGGSGDDVPAALDSLGPTLLVLDPIDRVVLDERAMAALTAWLDACPELAVLAVGRARTRIFGERVVELGVLSPDAALALFLELAALHRRGKPDERSAEDRAAAIAIVATLDHLPLALELAATRLAVMPLPALLHRLGNRWDVLKKSGATGRHGTLELAINWSLELLEPSERAILEGATIFRGGFSLEVAEAVLSAPPNGSVADALLSLRERSLLSVEEPLPGEIRLRLLESVRQLAERGLDAERTAALEERHAQAYVTAAESWAREVELFGSPDARARLSLEHDNLAIVVERILGRGQVSTRAADRALRVLCALGSVVGREGASALLRAHLETAIEVAQGSGADPRLLARALCLRGTLRAMRGALSAGERDLGEALVLANHSGERAIEARVLLASASVAASDGRRDEARALLDRAKAIADVAADRALGAQVRLAVARLDVADGALQRAALGLEEGRAQAQRSGDVAMRADAELELGRLALYEQRDATAHLEEALRLGEVLQDRAVGSEAALLLGVAAARAGRDPQPHLEASLVLARRSGQPVVLARAAVVLALHAHARGERGEARALLRDVLDALPRLPPDLVAAASEVLGRIERGAGVTLTELSLPRPPSDPVLAALRGLAPAAGPSLLLGALFGLGQAPRSERPPKRALRIDEEATFFAVDGQPPVDLSRRRPLRRLLAHLCRHAAGPSATPMPWDALLEVGWPGEKMRADAGAHRVRVAISTLRKMGLGGVIETGEDGYRVHKDVAVSIDRESE